jgi:hypothetical protein
VGGWGWFYRCRGGRTHDERFRRSRVEKILRLPLSIDGQYRACLYV